MLCCIIIDGYELTLTYPALAVAMPQSAADATSRHSAHTETAIPHPIVEQLSTASVSLALGSHFVLRKSGAATIAAARAKAVSVARFLMPRDCFLPSQFDFLSTKWRKARRRMQCNVISPHGTVLSPAIGYN
jgi:hypothetical protein